MFEDYCSPVWFPLSHGFSLSADAPQRWGLEKLQQVGWLLCDDRFSGLVILLLDVDNDDDEVRERSYSYSVPYWSKKVLLT